MVRCPACGHDVAVPMDVADPSPAPVLAPTPPHQSFFERDDFSMMLEGSANREGAKTASRAEQLPAGTPAPSPSALTETKGGTRSVGPAGVELVSARGGLVLTPAWATMLTVVFILLLALAFTLGLLVGRHAL